MPASVAQSVGGLAAFDIYTPSFISADMQQGACRMGFGEGTDDRVASWGQPAFPSLRGDVCDSHTSERNLSASETSKRENCGCLINPMDYDLPLN